MGRPSSYRSTTARFKGATQTMYIVYGRTHQYRGDVKHKRTGVKRFYVSGALRDWEGPSVFKNRKGRKVFGIRVTYDNPMVTRYGTRATATVTKVVPLPRGIRNVKVTSRPPKELMAVA